MHTYLHKKNIASTTYEYNIMTIEDNTIKIPTQLCTHNYKEIYTHIHKKCFMSPKQGKTQVSVKCWKIFKSPWIDAHERLNNHNKSWTSTTASIFVK